MSPTPLEMIESIDMLRILEHGGRVRLVETSTATHAVDTPADLAYVSGLMADDPLISAYKDLIQSFDMIWRLLVTAPYMLPLPQKYRTQLEHAGR